MSNPDVLIEHMLNNERTRAILLVSLISSDNDPETLPDRLETAKKLKTAAEVSRTSYVEDDNEAMVEKINSLIEDLDNCIAIIEADIEED